MTHVWTDTPTKEGSSRTHSALGWRPRRRKMERSQTADIRRTLTGVGIFAGLSPGTIEIVGGYCAWRGYELGEVIVDYLDPSNDVFFVVAGEVCVTIHSATGKAVSFRSLGAGTIFGEYAAIDGECRSASVEARGKCLIASMPAKTFRKLLETEPAVAQALIRELVRNVRTLTKRVYEFSTLAVNNRIQAELLRLANLGPRKGNSAILDPMPTHAEIASRVSTHREAVSRELSRLSRLGIVERQNGKLVIWDIERLSEMLHEMTGE